MKYPVLLVHGMWFGDDGIFKYWGRVPQKLEEMGCKVFLSGQDVDASIESNGIFVANRIDEILKETGADKVNIIAHSKGGLEARYIASTMGYGDKIASITTMQTPHNGSKTVDFLLKLPKFVIKLFCKIVDSWFRFKGDKYPDTHTAIYSFKTENAQKFNEENPDMEGIYYQSYAFVMKRFTSDMFLWFTNLVVSIFDGQNDGLLAPASVIWGDYKGVVKSNSNRGISHCDEVDFRRKPFTSKKGEGVSDILEVYEKVVVDLENMGF